MKPESKSFTYVLDNLKIPAQDIIFFDDNEQNIAVAQSLGIQAHLTCGFEQLKQHCHTLGLIT